MSGTFWCEKSKKPFLEVMLVNILIHLDVLLAVPILEGNSEKMPESELAFLVVISTAVIYTASHYLIGFLRTAPDTKK